MAAFNYKKINRKEHEKVAFLSLREFPKRKTMSKFETNSLVKVLTNKKVKGDKKHLLCHSADDS